MTTELNPVDKWKSIPWRKLRKVVFRLQVRIFKAQKNGNAPLVRKLQKLYEVLVKNWKQWKHQPLKRVYILKADGTRRGLGIPTISDRAYQCLIKYALEPSAEATFNARSYGFRPGRSCHDVQKLLFSNLNGGRANGLSKRILELDIEKCFDKIDHKFLMQSIQLPKAAKQGIYRAIKAGVRGEFPSSESGTPQGGVSALRSVQR